MRDEEDEKMPDVPDSTLTRGQARELLEHNAARRSPSTVADVQLRILRRRRSEIERTWRAMLDDVAHWNRAHPDEEPIVIEPITAAEIEAMKHER